MEFLGTRSFRQSPKLQLEDFIHRSAMLATSKHASVRDYRAQEPSRLLDDREGTLIRRFACPFPLRSARA